MIIIKNIDYFCLHYVNKIIKALNFFCIQFNTAFLLLFIDWRESLGNRFAVSEVIFKYMEY